MSKELVLVNEFCKLCFHSQSLRGVVQDYIISFEDDEVDLNLVVEKSYDLFEKLMEHFKNKNVKARLIAQINFIRMNDRNEIVGNEDYHFSSYSQERVF